MLETEENQEEKTSAKREIVATVVATGVGLVLNIGASILISKFSKKVHDRIAPENETEE